ncbi:GABA permease [Arthroderma uncinatum]|uniref:GABA permease n=1 Tax=Arthroderma uncinatum TaxID=74035 RepID=UPI00144A91AD|nr:GABA permease [Arthroderma uncinatum]KAF3480934.1 GABA permease [Arthroderma uncinatum]
MDRSSGSTTRGAKRAEAPVSQDTKLAEAIDQELLAVMGYKQELRRHYSTLQVFAIAFSIMGLLPSIASTLSFSLPAGPAAMVWADLSSALPTSGGLYWWTHHFAADKWKNPLSFLVGYSNTIGLIGGICSVDFVSVVHNGEWVASRNLIYGVYAATVAAHGILAILAAPIMHRIQSVCIVANVGLVLGTVIALPIGKSRTVEGINSATYVFGHVENLTTWPTGWAFMLAWLSPIWSVGAFDSCVHMSEEAINAAKAVPYGILWAGGACWSLGFLCLCVIAACMNTDPNVILKSPLGQPIAQIYYDALGKNGAIIFMVAMATVQFFMGLSITIAASRQTWAFSRDGALPFSKYLRVVSTRFRYQPARAVVGCAATSIILGLLCLVNSAASNALFSLTVAGNYFAWAMPIFCRIFWGQDKFKPGLFYTGRLSTPIAVVALLYMAFAITLSMFPTAGPSPSANDMNYTVVINGTVWIGSLLYYFLSAKKWFKGPRKTLDPASPTEAEHRETESEC